MSLQMERLEDRVLLAVSVTRSGQSLVINGTAGSDDVTLETVGTGEVIVTDNTTGQTYDFSGIRNITVNGRAGADIVTVNELDLDVGLLTVNAGDGNDDVVIDGSVAGRVTVNGGLGDDFVDFSSGNTVIDGNVLIKAGGGNDDLALGYAIYGGNLAVDAEAGHDEVNYDLVEVDGYFHLQLGSGDDSALGSGSVFSGTVHIEGGTGNDIVDHDAEYGGNLYGGILEIDMDGGRDFYREYDATVGGAFNADGGLGDDTIDQQGNTFLGTVKIQSF